VLAGTWDAAKGATEIEAADNDFDKAYGASQNKDAAAGLKIFEEVLAARPAFADVPYLLAPRLELLVKNKRFADVQGICVMLPAVFLEPGVVDTYGQPQNAILDLGRYPSGVDESSTALAAALEASGLASRALPDVMRWKHTKLLANLRNVLDALVGDQRADETKQLAAAARAEGIACLEAAGLERASDDEDAERRRAMKMTPIPGRERHGSSTYQSFARGDTSTEIDWLNGEIVLLGRLHGVPTPINEALCALARDAAADSAAPRSIPIDDVLRRVAR